MESGRGVVAIEELVIGATQSPKLQYGGLPTAPHKRTLPIPLPKLRFDPFFLVVYIHTPSPHDREQYLEVLTFFSLLPRPSSLYLNLQISRVPCLRKRSEHVQPLCT